MLLALLQNVSVLLYIFLAIICKDFCDGLEGKLNVHIKNFKIFSFIYFAIFFQKKVDPSNVSQFGKKYQLLYNNKLLGSILKKKIYCTYTTSEGN